MRIEISCTVCAQNKSWEESPYVMYSRLCTICDDGIYEFECPEGHRSKTVLRTPKHEVLFTIASNALLDGYFRDAIASFAASLERFYEFVIRVICRRSIDQQNFEQCWQAISKQSERQLGAFNLLWLIETGEPPSLLSNSMTQLRNQVIHQGKVPTYQECIRFGQAVIDVIAPVECKMLDAFSKEHKDECFAPARSEKEKYGKPITVLSIFSVLEAAIKDGTDLESCLDRLRLQRSRYGILSISNPELRTTLIHPTSGN